MIKQWRNTMSSCEKIEGAMTLQIGTCCTRQSSITGTLYFFFTTQLGYILYSVWLRICKISSWSQYQFYWYSIATVKNVQTTPLEEYSNIWNLKGQETKKQAERQQKRGLIFFFITGTWSIYQHKKIYLIS